MTRLTPTPLIAIVVPEDAHSFEINEWHTGLFYTLNNIKHLYPFDDSRGAKFSLLGYAIKDEVSFDADEYVDWHERTGNVETRWFDYVNENGWTNSSADSLRSLLSSHDLNFVNPLGEEPIPEDFEDYHYGRACFKSWQVAENKLIKKTLIIKK